MRKRALLSREELRPDDLLTLAQACEVLLNGNLTPASLRREREKGRLVTFKIAGKEFVTPNSIIAMRLMCTCPPIERVEGLSAFQVLDSVEAGDLTLEAAIPHPSKVR
ncbi:hypothetical protein [Jiella sonneratiae]|uniref:hypothetical protein n=1 Tax=Jiella sonneratiae TaxID=2816856 RepID=UPI001A93AE40|nr:hypothetical protein [Jiella sonneratiae]